MFKSNNGLEGPVILTWFRYPRSVCIHLCKSDVLPGNSAVRYPLLQGLREAGGRVSVPDEISPGRHSSAHRASVSSMGWATV